MGHGRAVTDGSDAPFFFQLAQHGAAPRKAVLSLGREQKLSKRRKRVACHELNYLVRTQRRQPIGAVDSGGGEAWACGL
jgi:hypothetical protein